MKNIVSEQSRWNSPGYMVKGRADSGLKWKANTNATDFTLLNSAIESSKYMFDLPPEWLEDGGVAIDRAVWERATEFIRSVYARIYRHFGGVEVAPRITHGIGGGVDIAWAIDGKRIFLAFSKDSSNDQYYLEGDNPKIAIDGRISDTDVTTLLTCL